MELLQTQIFQFHITGLKNNALIGFLQVIGNSKIFENIVLKNNIY